MNEFDAVVVGAGFAGVRALYLYDSLDAPCIRFAEWPKTKTTPVYGKGAFESEALSNPQALEEYGRPIATQGHGATVPCLITRSWTSPSPVVGPGRNAFPSSRRFAPTSIILIRSSALASATISIPLLSVRTLTREAQFGIYHFLMDEYTKHNGL